MSPAVPRPNTPVDRDAILDRYRRVAPQAERSVRGTGSGLAPSARLASPSSSRRGAIAREKAGSDSAAAREIARAAERATPATRRAMEATRGLRDVAAVDPARADRILRYGNDIARTTGAAVGAGLSCFYSGWSSCWGGWGWSGCWGWSYWWNWGCLPYSWYCHPFSWCSWYWWGWWPYSIGYWYPSAYSNYYTPPYFYSTVVQQYYEQEDEPTYVEVEEGEDAAQPAAEAAQVARPGARGPDSRVRASGQYLTLGDQAFRDGRYSDAVHFYARAVEFAPEEGVLYLVLSDGLFATGDYHYGAFALRRALELDPTLASSAVDKHAFYGDPQEFDRQLAVLEAYLSDRPGDDDARLMLAANYLFGGRPAAAVDLLDSPNSERVRAEPAGALILQAARELQYGRPAPK